jgi:hypothetical protein
MRNWLSNLFGPQPLKVEKDSEGNWLYTMFSSRGNQHKLLSDDAKLRLVLRSPAALFVFGLQADMFSLGRIKSKDDNNILKTLRKRPNYKSGWNQFKWDYMFWTMMGTAYLYKSGGKILDDNNTVEWLNPAKLMWEPTVTQKMMDFIFTKQTAKDIFNQTVRYTQSNGKVKYIPLKDISPIHDLSSNMNDNFYVGISRVDALYKVIMLSEDLLDAESINAVFTGRWMVSGKQDPNNTTQLPMGVDEKKDISDKIKFGDNVQVNKSAIDIKRFTDNFAAQKFDDAFWAQVYTFAKMYNIPKDVIEAYMSGGKGATYENQEKAMVRHIEHTLKPKGENLTEVLDDTFDNVKDIEMSWSHLASYNVFEMDKQNVVTLKLNNAILAKENQLKLSDYE